MNFKKTACLLIMSILLITSLSACAGGKDSSSDAEGAATSAGVTPAGDWTTLKKYEPGLTFTMSSTITPEKLQEQNGDMALIGNWSD